MDEWINAGMNGWMDGKTKGGMRIFIFVFVF